MVDIFLDTETKGLEATRKAFLYGCIVDNKERSKIFMSPDNLWNYIIEKGKTVSKYGAVLNVYAHNMGNFDFWTFAEYTNNKLKYFSTSPFIATYVEDEKEIVKFLDTYSLYKMPLWELGEMIGLKKMETPEILKSGKDLTEEEIKSTIPYCINDTMICKRAIEMMKNKLKKDNVSLKRLYTIHQVAIQYMLNELKKKERPYIFYNPERNQLLYTKDKKLVREAYRGGRVECFKTGKIEDVTYIDCNSLYPYSLMNFRFPDLRTQRKVMYPLNIYRLKEILSEIGIHRALIKNESDDIGLIPIRTIDFSYYPKKGKMMIGTWTGDELIEAMNNGYKIIDIEWSIMWNEATENPYKEIIPKLYDKRKDGTKFNNYFYKSVMNNHLGKFAQIRNSQEIVFDNVENTKKYLAKGFKIIKGIDNTLDYQFKKEVEHEYDKSYYCPIIPILANAFARVHMYRMFKKVGIKDLVYSDTDSIMFTGDHKEKFKISNEIGDFKVELEHKDALIWGRKTYSIGERMHAGGIHKADLNPKDFEKGYIESNKMITLGQTTDLSKVGTFKKERKDLREQLNNFNKSISLLEEQDILIDYSILDSGIRRLEYFEEHLV